MVQTNQNNSEEIWAKLTSITQTAKPEIFSLKDNKITIGRNTNNTICIPDKRSDSDFFSEKYILFRLSGTHCEINKEDNLITIIDCSTNGTFVNNEKVILFFLDPMF